MLNLKITVTCLPRASILPRVINQKRFYMGTFGDLESHPGSLHSPVQGYVGDFLMEKVMKH